MLYKYPQLELLWRDGSGSTGVTNVWLRAGASVVQAVAAAEQLANLAAAVSDAAVIGCRVRYVGVEPEAFEANGLTPAEQAGLFVFGTAETEALQLATVSIPALYPGLYVVSGPGIWRLVNQDAPTVQAFVTELTSGIWCNPFAYPLTSLESAYLQVLP